MHHYLPIVVLYFVAGAFASEGIFDYRPQSDWKKICHQGKHQSPINIDTGDAQPPPQRSGRMDYKTLGVVNKYMVYFTGHALQVEFEHFSKPADVRMPANTYTVGNSTTVHEGALMLVEPLQMHFHTASEHTFNGFHAPAELHIVLKVKEGQSDFCDSTDGCLVVIGVLMKFEGEGSDSHKLLKRLFTEMPEGVGKENGIEFSDKLNLDDLMPDNLDHYTYLGSLTTPPCVESATWMVLDNPIMISSDLVEKHQALVAFTPGEDCTFTFNGVCTPPREKTNNRPIQPLNGRTVYFVKM